MIQLICSDIDGTLLNKDRQLSVKTIHIIKQLNHIPFVLISSRMPKAMVHLQRELNITHLPLIAYNGGLILHQGKVISTTEIPNNIAINIVDFCINKEVHVSLYHHDEWFVPSMDYWAKREQNNTKVTPEVKILSKVLTDWIKEKKGAHKIMCMGDEKALDLLVLHIEKNYSDTIIGYRSKPTYLEISHKKISKKTAIKSLIKKVYPNIDSVNIIAFGDNYNDVHMIDYVGVGVAVANAISKTIDVSNFTTESNKNDGVALFLEKYFKII